MAQSHKAKADCTHKAIELVENVKSQYEKLKTWNDVLIKENEALKKKVKELGGRLGDDEEWVKL